MTDDTVTAKLAEWEALVEGATKGPYTLIEQGGYWVKVATADGYALMVGDASGDGTARAPDARFIAAARAAMPALLGFVREVRKGHEARTWTEYGVPVLDEFDSPVRVHHGCACGHKRWPCPTEQAARKWIGGEGRG